VCVCVLEREKERERVREREREIERKRGERERERERDTWTSWMTSAPLRLILTREYQTPDHVCDVFVCVCVQVCVCVCTDVLKASQGHATLYQLFCTNFTFCISPLTR
jgi:hypothetical protein